jgi:hypothetical protein
MLGFRPQGNDGILYIDMISRIQHIVYVTFSFLIALIRHIIVSIKLTLKFW